MLVKLTSPVGRKSIIQADRILYAYTMDQSGEMPGHTLIRFINSEYALIVAETPAEIYAMLESGF